MGAVRIDPARANGDVLLALRPHRRRDHVHDVVAPAVRHCANQRDQDTPRRPLGGATPPLHATASATASLSLNADVTAQPVGDETQLSAGNSTIAEVLPPR
ncbi:MAG: hypothetical protein HRT86_04120 [Ilumatobacteraceae bacterium]|nr:hypothetical protein [Ilumatobacteraceae bacterium]